MAELKKVSEKLNRMLQNVRNRYALKQQEIKDGIKAEKSVRDQYEALLGDAVEKLESIDRDGYSDAYEEQLLRVKDLQLKVSLSTETIVTLQSGLIESGMQDDEDMEP